VTSGNFTGRYLRKFGPPRAQLTRNSNKILRIHHSSLSACALTRAFGLFALRVTIAPWRSDSQMTSGFGFGSAAIEISIDSFPLNRVLNALQTFNNPPIIRIVYCNS